MVVLRLCQKFPHDGDVTRLFVVPEASVSQVVEDVPEVSAVAVNEVTSVFLSLDGMSAAVHGRPHRVIVSGEGQGRGRVEMTTDVQFDPALLDLVDL